MSRAARNSTCCDHAAADHDLFGCGVNLSTEQRTYVRCHGLVQIADVQHLIAAAIGDDEDPGLTGEALDAWNAATARAVNIAHNWPSEATLGRGVDAPTSENARIVRGLRSSRPEIEADQ